MLLAASGTASSGPVAEATNVMPASVPVKSSPAFSSAAPKSLPTAKKFKCNEAAFAVDVKQKVAATNKIEIAAPPNLDAFHVLFLNLSCKPTVKVIQASKSALTDLPKEKV